MSVERDQLGRPKFYCPKCGWSDYTEDRDIVGRQELCPECVKGLLHEMGVPFIIVVERF